MAKVARARPPEVKATIPFKPEVHAKLVDMAIADGRSLGRYVEAIAERHVAAQERKAAK